MPVLSLYLGSSETSYLVASENKEPILYNYPYPFTYQNTITEILYQSLKELKVKQAETTFYATGFPELPKDTLNIHSLVNLDDLINEDPIYFPYHVDNFTLITPKGVKSAMDISQVMDEDLGSFLNLTLYPQLVYTDDFDRIDMDNMVRFSSSDVEPDKNSKPVVFTGDRFSVQFRKDPLSFVLMCDLIKTPGVFQVRLDSKNLYAPAALLSKVDSAFSHYLSEVYFEPVGTMINIPGGGECLLQSEDGSKQLITVEDNHLFAIPMAVASKAKILIKNSVTGNSEYSVLGGKLGLIFDSRPKNDPKLFNRKYYEQEFKNWNNLISEVICSSL